MRWSGPLHTHTHWVSLSRSVDRAQTVDAAAEMQIRLHSCVVRCAPMMAKQIRRTSVAHRFRADKWWQWRTVEQTEHSDSIETPLSSTLNRISARLFAQADQKINTENGMECKKAEYNENTSQVICKTSYLLYKQWRNTLHATDTRSHAPPLHRAGFGVTVLITERFRGFSCTVSFRAVSRPLCNETTWK